jgi:hypothetical protein
MLEVVNTNPLELDLAMSVNLKFKQQKLAERQKDITKKTEQAWRKTK